MGETLKFAQYEITSPQGQRWGKMHNGVDIGTPLNTEIQSTTDGTVVYTGYDKGGFGNYIKIQDSAGNIHYYGHLNKIATAKGESVKAGEFIGYSGSTGRSTGAHLHYQVVSPNGEYLNAVSFINAYQNNTTFTGSADVNLLSATVADTGKSIGSKVSLFVVLLLCAVFGVIFFTKAIGVDVNGLFS